MGIVALGFALFGMNRAPVEAPAAGPPGGIECADVMRNVDGFLAGRLDRETTAKVEQHLAACPMCGPYVRGMRSTRVEATSVFGAPELVAHVDDILVRRPVRSAAVR